jgi:hypothetical protein
MARIDIRSNGGAALNDGVLQLENGVAMDATLRNVADQNNTTSPLKLSTTAVQVTSPLRITTSDASGFYLDAEDSATNNRFSIKRDPSAQEVTLDFASNPAGSTTTVGAIRTYGDGVNLSNAVTFREDGQVTFTERINIEADSLVTTETCSVIAASTTNANLVIAPNGTGALIADIPDGTATGGNARGENAVDLQTIRNNQIQVASGNYSTISGGQNNRAHTGTHGTVTGGFTNVASGNYATVGGESSTSSGQTSTAFGYLAVASGQAAVFLGNNGTSSGNYSFAAGSGHTASGRSTVCLGETNTASAQSSIALGNQSKAYLLGQQSLSSGIFSAQSDAQQSQATSRREAALTTGGTTVLGLDGGGGPNNTLIPDGNNRSWNVQVRWVAVVTAITGTATGVTVGDTKTSTDLLAVAKRGGVTTVSAHTSAGTHVIETIAGSLTAANINYTAGGSGQMQITFTGPTFAGGGSVTMRVVAAISLTEVAY